MYILYNVYDVDKYIIVIYHSVLKGDAKYMISEP